jgi:hypothetical protein
VEVPATARVLAGVAVRRDAPNRMFPTKAVRIWRVLNDCERAGLITAYFKYAGAGVSVTQTPTSTAGL